MNLSFFGRVNSGKGRNPKVLALRRLLLIFIAASALGVAPYAHAGFFSEILKLFSTVSSEDRRTAFIQETEAASNAAPILGSVPNPESFGDEFPELNFVQGNSIVAPANPLGTLQDGNGPDRIFLYTVKPGDTPSAIARSFGVSINTILWANNIKSAGSIRVGDQLLILPVSGLKHVVKKGETADSIAKRYRADLGDILAFNGLPAGVLLETGLELIIPDGELPATQSQGATRVQRFAGLPALAGYFLRPIQGGRKSQGIHGQNGVDLANSCGTPIAASAPGEVLIVRETGYNGGFGKFIAINHPNGTQTVYAHNQKNMVAAGEEVTRGQIIGFVGNTGNTRGSTGCHVHFEIHGAKNPF